MASTLGVLDVLSQLREESERASAALTAQEEAIRSLRQRCIEAETESGRTDSVKGALRHQKMQLDQGRRIAEKMQQEAECRLRRLRKQRMKREQAAASTREANAAAAADVVESSKKFRTDAYESVRQIGELRARLQDKRRELDSVQEEKSKIDEEIKSKKATRDKVKAELESQAEAVAAAYSKVEHAEGENKSSLARAKLIEAEIDETRQAQDEMQEMAVGLQRRNAILRNELRHLKRQVEGDSTGRQDRGMMSPNHNDETSGSDNSTPLRVGGRRPSSSATATRVVIKPKNGSGGGVGGSDSGHFYHHSSVPRQDEDRTAAELQLEAGNYQQYGRGTSDHHHHHNSSNNNSNRQQQRQQEQQEQEQEQQQQPQQP
ncbi:unnamed protein product [Pylaiella littoralis]